MYIFNNLYLRWNLSLLHSLLTFISEFDKLLHFLPRLHQTNSNMIINTKYSLGSRYHLFFIFGIKIQSHLTSPPIRIQPKDLPSLHRMTIPNTYVPTPSPYPKRIHQSKFKFHPPIKMSEREVNDLVLQ